MLWEGLGGPKWLGVPGNPSRKGAGAGAGRDGKTQECRPAGVREASGVQLGGQGGAGARGLLAGTQDTQGV